MKNITHKKKKIYYCNVLYMTTIDCDNLKCSETTLCFKIGLCI